MRLTGCKNIKAIQDRGLSLLSGYGVDKLRIIELENNYNKLLHIKYINSATEKHENTTDKNLSFLSLKK